MYYTEWSICYVIATPQSFELTTHFDVFNINCLLPHIHAPLYLEIKYTRPLERRSTEDNNSSAHVIRPRWNRSKAHGYISNIDRAKVQELIESLQYLEGREIEKAGNTNNINDHLGNILINSATKTFVNIGRKSMEPRVGNRGWFGKECKIARSNYRKAEK